MNGKQKGSQFERDVCKALSLWVTHGKRTDAFWRSAMSGGRATVHKHGDVRQAGDITAVAPEGHKLTDSHYIECKFYKDLNFDGLIKGSGKLLDFWEKTLLQATRYQRIPVLIAKQNMLPTLLITDDNFDQRNLRPMIVARRYNLRLYIFDELMKTKCPL
jgi:hypothetical protein